jgi:hypothetical protein
MSDTKTAITRVAAATSNGLQEITIADLGWTPKAAVFEIIGATANATYRADAAYGDGAIGGDGAGGLNEWAYAATYEDGITSTSTDCGRAQRTDSCILIVEMAAGARTVRRATGDGNGSSGNPGPIANGWRVNWVSAPSQAYLIQVTFFGGADLQSHCNQFQLSTQDTAVDITAPGFRPKFVRFGGIGLATNPPTDGAAHRLLRGIAIDDTGVPQAGCDWGCRNAVSTEQLQSVVVSNRAGVKNNQTTTGIAYTMEISDFDASGFTATARGGSGGNDWHFYLALGLGDRKAWTAAVQGPASTGSDWSVTGPGFTPQLAGFFATNMASLDTAVVDGPDCESMASAIFDGSQAFATLVTGFDGTTSGSDSASWSRNATLRTAEDSQSTVYDIAGAPAFTANGWTVAAADINAVPASAGYFVAWAIEAMDDAPAASSRGLMLLGVGT